MVRSTQSSLVRDEWNDAQWAFITQPLGPGTLLGIPGGGKTRSLLGRILHLIDSAEIPPKGGFVVLTFSRAACEDFLRKGASMREGVFNTSNVRTVHSLAGALVHKFAGCKSSLETVVYRAAKECERRGPEELRTVACCRRLRAVFVDEAQDLSEVQYHFATALGRALDAPVVLVGDPNQSIYQFQGGSDRYLREHPGFQVALDTQYRSTGALVRFIAATRPVPGGAMRAQPSAAEGRPPRLVSGTASEIQQDLVARIRALPSLDATTVAVLGPVKRSKPDPQGELVSLGLQWAAQVLRDAGIPVELHYAEDAAETSSRERGGAKAIAPGRVHFLTAHGSKGLEFDHVFVLNYHHATMSRVPKTRAQEEEFAYLWYVALSRARHEMTIYRLAHKPVWPGFHRQDLAGLCETVGPQPRRAAPRAEEDEPPQLAWTWTELLGDRKLLDEAQLATLEDLWEIRLEALPALPGAEELPEALPLQQELATLYGIWAEELFYHAYRGELPPMVRRIEDMINGCISVPAALTREAARFCHVLGMKPSDLVSWGTIERHRRQLLAHGLSALVAFLDGWRARHHGVHQFLLYRENPIQWFDIAALKEMVESWRAEAAAAGGLSSASIWRMCLFHWQFANEARWRWQQEDDPFLAALAPFERRIRRWAAELPDGFLFQQGGSLPHLPVSGAADAVCAASRTLLEFKFSPQTPAVAHGLQAQGYAEMLFPGREIPSGDVQVWNLRTGERARVRATQDRRARWEVYAHLARVLGTPLQDVCWAYDLETTGLDPCTCGVAEIHVEECTSGLVPVSTLVHQREMPAEAQAVTQITTAMLREAPREELVVLQLDRVLQLCERPVLLAHNGHAFDHRILQRLLPRDTQSSLGWADSRFLFPVLGLSCDDRGVSKSLGSLYEKIVGRPFEGQAHRAEADVRMMVEILARLELTSSKVRGLVRQSA